MRNETSWVAADWGTSNLRIWGIGAADDVTFSASSPKGMGRLTPQDYPKVLADLLAEAGHETGAVTDVLICGMAGARQGWAEAPYLEAPADLRGLAAGTVAPETSGVPVDVRILPGICQKTPGAENVMRGEETQLLGLSQIAPGYSGAVCMPGTHSKWAVLEGTRLTRFTTAMTGELYEVLATHSILRHSVDQAQAGTERDAGFKAGVAVGLEAPEALTSNLFAVRAAALLSGRDADWCSGYLSGLLIGTEVAADRSWIGGEAIPVIGSPALSALYGKAITAAGGTFRIIDATEATIAGLKAARAFNTH